MKYDASTNWDDPTVKIQLLKEIKEILLTKGWTRGYNEHRGRVCLNGARNLALYGNPSSIGHFGSRSLDVIGDAVTNYHGKWIGVTNWNDAVAKSRVEVIKMLDKEIERLEANV